MALALALAMAGAPARVDGRHADAGAGGEQTSQAAAKPERGGLPENLVVDPSVRPRLERMWQASPTFRRQCERLAVSKVSVRVLAHARWAMHVSKASTASLSYRGGTLASAVIDIPLLSSRLPELVAHEVEHILEQIDGVNLEALAGNGDVWRAGDAFETRRAIDVGRRVARELAVRGRPDVRRRDDDDPWATFAPVALLDSTTVPPLRPPVRVSGDGRYVAFATNAPLVAADRNRLSDVYVYDRYTATMTLESVGPGGRLSNGSSEAPDISGDGRFVVFESVAGNLIDDASASGLMQIFVRDRLTGTVRLLTRNAGEMPGNKDSSGPVISADGTTVIFESSATDLAGSVVSGAIVGVYLVRLDQTGQQPLVVSSVSTPEDNQSVTPSVSGDGRFVAFMSTADETCGPGVDGPAGPADRNGIADVYVRDTVAHTTVRISRSYLGGDANGPSHHPAISGDGRYVAFVSEASNLMARGRRGPAQIYVHDRETGVTERVTHTSRGRGGNAESRHPAISHDGRLIAFVSLASDLACAGTCPPGEADVDLMWDVFLHDRTTGRTVRADGPASSTGHAQWPALSAQGHVVALVAVRGSPSGPSELLTTTIETVAKGPRTR